MALAVMTRPLIGRIASISTARLQLVGLGIDPQLGPDGPDVGGVSGQKVDRGRLAVAATAEGFAIDGKVRRVARTRCPVAASIEADSVTVPVTDFDELFEAQGPIRKPTHYLLCI
jgi:hypothetical protein